MQKNQASKKLVFLIAVSNKDILASKNARHFCKKGELNSIKKSLRWAQSGFCSFYHLEVTSKTINLYLEWLIQQSKFQICETKSSFTKWNAIYSAWTMENSNHWLGKNILPSCTFSMRFWSMHSELINELPGCRFLFSKIVSLCKSFVFAFSPTISYHIL